MEPQEYYTEALTGANLARAATAYTRLGWRVHPLRPRDKRPMLSGWQERASADPETVAAWWRETPQANIGIATGPDSGVFVLDVDADAGERSLTALEGTHGALPNLYPMQRTGGGWQAFFAWPEGRDIRNSANRLGAHLDTRGAGGYVVAPPSVHPSGAIYAWGDERDPLAIPPEPAPCWLVDLLDPPQAPEPERPETWQGHKKPSANARALKALESELALVAVAPEGRRNDTLNRAAHALFRFVRGDELPGDIVRDGLAHAATHAGLPHIEAMKTIKSAANARGVNVG